MRPNDRLLATPQADADVTEILAYSFHTFGLAALDRYERLLTQAMRDIEADPFRLGAKQRLEISEGLYSYHIAHSKTRAGGGAVATPRHILLYKADASDQTVLLVRVLHERMDLTRHLPE